MTWSVVLHLAFQSIGVVYGDIGTSPLYVLKSVFSGGIRDTEDVVAVLSLILYTLTLLPLVKYVLIVLHANDNGEGNRFSFRIDRFIVVPCWDIDITAGFPIPMAQGVRLPCTH